MAKVGQSAGFPDCGWIAGHADQIAKPIIAVGVANVCDLDHDVDAVVVQCGTVIALF